MFNASLPQFLSRSVVRQLETDGRFELLELTRPNFYIEIMTLVADLQDFRPGEPVDPQTIAIDQKTRRADT